MAPLSGFETSPVATLWNRLGAFLYEHGERFYNFQGLRAYKQKFNPDLGAALPGVPGRLEAGADPRRRVGADRRRLPSHLPQVAAAHSAAEAYMYS